MNAFVQKLDRLCAGMARPLAFLVALITRLALGLSFFFAGKGKLADLDATTKNFEALGIPLASIQAPFVGGLELVGGAALALGLLTRPFAAILSVVMVVALISAHSGDVSASFAFDGKQQLINIHAFYYLLFLLLIWIHGPGRLSVDSLLFDTEAQPQGKGAKS
ncbi:MAG: DoxX family protein [Planctomycetes bacterium]|nr:DoxX family protein [Planctomycetota bacterium]